MASSTIKIAAESNWTGIASGLFNGVSVADMTHIKMASDVALYGFETIYAGDRMEILPVMGMD